MGTNVDTTSSYTMKSSYTHIRVTMFLLLIFIKSCVAISLAQELRGNKLNASLGINFKYNDNLNHNLDYIWIVTRIKLLKFNDIHMPSIKYDSNCSFIHEANFNTPGNEVKENKHTLWFFFISLCSFIHLIKEKGDTLYRYNRKTFRRGYPFCFKR